MTPDCSAATVARSFVASEVLHGRSTLLSTAMTQRVMTASEVLTWIAFRKPERWSRADPKMKFFVDAWKVRSPTKKAPPWQRLEQLFAKADAELLQAISKHRKPVYRSEGLRIAAEANEYDRDRRCKLDDAAKQIREACAAADVMATGRRPAEWGKPSINDHEVIPAAAFSGSHRTIKADGRLLDTQGGTARVVWQSLEFRTGHILLFWPHEVQISNKILQGSSAKASRDTQRPLSADVDRWFEARTQEFSSSIRHPTEAEDQAAADEKFGIKMVSRETIRGLRIQFVPAERRRQGPGRKQSAKPPRQSAPQK